MNTTIHKIVDLAIELSDLNTEDGLNFNPDIYTHSQEAKVEVSIFRWVGVDISSSYYFNASSSDETLQTLELIKHHGFRDDAREVAA